MGPEREVAHPLEERDRVLAVREDAPVAAVEREDAAGAVAEGVCGRLGPEDGHEPRRGPALAGRREARVDVAGRDAGGEAGDQRVVVAGPA